MRLADHNACPAGPKARVWAWRRPCDFGFRPLDILCGAAARASIGREGRVNGFTQPAGAAGGGKHDDTSRDTGAARR
jgi:hypothetical protein